MSMTESASTLPGVGSPLRLEPVTNLERMYALDEAWNARGWDTFDAYHEQSAVVVYWPGREGTPTQGGRDHRAESIRFCAAFPDNCMVAIGQTVTLPAPWNDRARRDSTPHFPPRIEIRA
jgi:hypothetical protein